MKRSSLCVSFRLVIVLVCSIGSAAAQDHVSYRPSRTHDRGAISWGYSEPLPSKSLIRQASFTDDAANAPGDSPPLPGSDQPQSASHNSTPAYAKQPVYRPLADVFDPSKYPTVKVTGFFQLDTGWFDQDVTNRLTVGDIQDGSSFRRARIAAKGNVTEQTRYIIEFDFAASQPRFVDVFMEFDDVPLLGHVRVGRWRQPFGMAELTSVRDLPFLERAAFFTFAPFRQTGIGFYDHSDEETMTWALSGYRFQDDSFGNNTGDNGGWGLAGRLTFLPYYEDDGERLVHFGLDYSFNDPSIDTLRYFNQPEIQIGRSTGGLLQSPFFGVPAFVNTGLVPTRDVNLFGVEAAAAMGPLYLQSEARWAVVKLLDGSSETLPGAYAQLRYVLTGERLPYHKKNGVFGRIVPRDNFDFHGGPGAWEATFRWSYIDLNGNGFPGPGRRLNDLTAGLNWYLNGHTKVQFNYIHAFLNDPVLGDSDADIAAVRAQIDF